MLCWLISVCVCVCFLQLSVTCLLLLSMWCCCFCLSLTLWLASLLQRLFLLLLCHKNVSLRTLQFVFHGCILMLCEHLYLTISKCCELCWCLGLFNMRVWMNMLVNCRGSMFGDIAFASEWVWSCGSKHVVDKLLMLLPSSFQRR